MAPSERLPDSAPLPLFFLPNFVGILLAMIAEKYGFEEYLASFLHAEAHRFGLLGLGVFAIANANSFLGGSVVRARIEYNVKLPNLYASTSSKQGGGGGGRGEDENANAILFNCVQRGHQNFLETYAHLVLAVLFTAFVADRPNVAGFILLTVSVSRIFYAMGYQSDIASRMSGQLISVFSMSIGIGYAFLVGVSTFGI